MSKRVDTLTIEGIQYQVSQVGAETADRILFRVGQALAAALQRGSIGAEDPSLATMMNLVRFLTAEDFVWLRNEMKGATKVGIVDEAGDKRVTFTPLAPLYDDHFRGRHMAMITWLKGALETNFGDFFVEARKALESVSVRAAAPPSPPPQAVAGSSGASSSLTG